MKYLVVIVVVAAFFAVACQGGISCASMDCPDGYGCVQDGYGKPQCEHKGDSSDDCLCIEIWDPVCGVNGKTYQNYCFLNCAGVQISHKGEC